MPNIELNTLIGSAEERDALREWFDALWTDDELTRDAKQEVLAALARLGAAYAPEFVYYKTLFHIFEERLAERGERDGLVQDVDLDKTAVWKALYEFQRNGATNAINRLLRHNGWHRRGQRWPRQDLDGAGGHQILRAAQRTRAGALPEAAGTELGALHVPRRVPQQSPSTRTALATRCWRTRT